MSELIVVTGAAGFIGGHVSAALLQAGFGVRGLDNFDPFYDRALKERAVAQLCRDERFTFREGDIRDGTMLRPLLDGAAAVVHLAARAGVRPSLEAPALYAAINVEGTAALLEACRQRGVRRFLFGSSSAVYGDDTAVPFREDALVSRPISPYAATKRAGELLCQTFSHLYGLRIAVLRCFTVYGPRQRPDLAIHKFTRLLTDGKPVPQYGDGSAERDHTHVSDIVQGVLGALEWSREEGADCELFNLGESRTVRLDTLIQLIASALGVRPRIERLPPQPGDVRRTCADTTKARRVLGYAPKVTIEEGIPEFVNWFRSTYGH